MSNSLRNARELLTYLGPGFLISVAYMDPGNWATNISGGAKFGTALLWVIVLASVMAMGIQILAAKLGIATGKGIAQLCREHLPSLVVWVLWAAAELAMIATDMAEIIGAAIGFSLVFGLPLAAGAVLAGVSSFVLLGVRSAHRRGFRAIEFAIMALVGVIALAFLFEVWLAKPSAANVAAGLAPSLPDATALYVAIGILGATVMPHSIYLHPYIVQDRRKRLVAESGDTDDVHRRHLRFESVDTILALFGAMFVNAAMLVVAAAALTGTGIETLEEAYLTLAGVFGANASLAFGVALIAAGLSSSLVATMSGQTVMDGFLDWNVSVWVRRSVTLVPSIAVVAAGFDPTSVLVASQVALSFELPFVLLPLLYFTREKRLMGAFTNRRPTTAALGVVVAVVVALNGWLLYATLLG
ncbi:Nramp family divalent metal transporter [Halocalculus aciditolerans]|uniref:Divalent metal cation transporter MntH n=1 Tax=Halocalculus aciditolerans TaxID=1383812 RepID=A0A830F833_9EURY|nr:Nramp family divalent metal transporter [Halocalculus aciditolerans]GGL48577.1 divalent metal cation transporter MntH [Halocalculus aciditolerans]